MATTRIQGITIEINGNPTPLIESLKTVDKELKKTQDALKDVNKLLKLDPGNTELLRQKQKDLAESIKTTKDRLQQLKEAQSQVNKGTDEWDALQREIIATETELKQLEKEYRNFGSVAAQQVALVGEKMKTVGQKMSDVGRSLSMYVTAPLVALGTKGVASFAEVDKTMQLTNKTMQNTEEEAELLETAMEKAAAASVFGMEDAAQASLNFARAGLTAAEAADTLAPAMNLAAGEGGDLNVVSAGLVATINGFHGSFSEAAHYADVFANACNNSALDINSLSESMSIAAPVFSAAGYSIEDASLYLGVMADNGIEANKAANSLKTGLARLVSPPKQAADKLDELNWSITNADGSMKDTITIQRELNQKFSEMSEAEQIAAASAIFGKNQMAPWLALINAAPADVEELSKALKQEGTTAEMAETMMSGFGGSLMRLKSSIDVAVNALGEALAPTISLVAGKIQQLVNWFNGLSDEEQQQVVKIGMMVAALGPLLLIGGKLTTGLGQLLTYAPKIVSVLGITGTSVAGVIAPLLGIVAAVGAIIAVVKTLWKNNEEFRNKITAIWEDLKKTWDECTSAITDALNELGFDFKDVSEVISAVWKGLCDILAPLITGALETVKTVVKFAIQNITSVIQFFVKVFKGDWKGALDVVKNTTSNILNAVANLFTTKFNTILNFVQGIVNKLKNVFNFKWKLPDIKLPHFSVTSGKTVFGITLPKISVSWYKKAYENPFLFTTPTIMNGRGFGDGGGSGEIVYGRDQLMRDIAAATSGETTINIYATPGMDVNQLADKVQQRLAQVQRQRASVYA